MFSVHQETGTAAINRLYLLLRVKMESGGQAVEKRNTVLKASKVSNWCTVVLDLSKDHEMFMREWKL